MHLLLGYQCVDKLKLLRRVANDKMLIKKKQKLLLKWPLLVLDLGYNIKPYSLSYSNYFDFRGDSHDFCYVSRIRTDPISQRISYILMTGRYMPEEEIE